MHDYAKLAEAGEKMCRDIREIGRHRDLIDTGVSLSVLDMEFDDTLEQDFDRAYHLTLGFSAFGPLIKFLTIWHRSSPDIIEDGLTHIQFESFGDIPEEEMKNPSIFLKAMLMIAMQWEDLLPGILVNAEYRTGAGEEYTGKDTAVFTEDETEALPFLREKCEGS